MYKSMNERTSERNMYIVYALCASRCAQRSEIWNHFDSFQEAEWTDLQNCFIY